MDVDRAKQTHWVAAGIAVVLSLLLHVLAYEKIPSMAFHAPVDVNDAGRVKRNMHLVETPASIRQVVEAVGGNEVWSPEQIPALASAQLDEPIAQTAAGSLLDHDDAGLLKGEEAPLDVPEFEEFPPLPRQSIMEIADPRIEPDVSFMPRVFMPDIPRVDDAPDVSWGDVLEADNEFAAMPSGVMDDLSLDVVSGMERDIREDLLAKQRVEVEEIAAEQIAGEASAELSEKPAEITDVVPVDELLQLTLYTYEAPNDEEGFFEMSVSRAGDEHLPVLPKDILLVQDCSESMTQRKLDYCKEGLQRWLALMRYDDRFNIVGFREEPYACFTNWVTVNAQTRARAAWFVSTMEARGRTDVYASLQEMLRADRDENRPFVAVILTDGRPTTGVRNSSEIIAGFTDQNDGGISVFAVGGGARVNRFILDFVTYQNRGDSLVVEHASELPEAISRWMLELDRPVLHDLQVQFLGVQDAEIYPKALTHLFLDRPLRIYGRYPKGKQELACRILGHSGEQIHDMVFRMDLRDARAGTAGIRQKWMTHRLYSMVGRYLNDSNPSALEEINRLSEKYGITVPYRRKWEK